jgi:hypothetical protein
LSTVGVGVARARPARAAEARMKDFILEMCLKQLKEPSVGRDLGSSGKRVSP